MKRIIDEEHAPNSPEHALAKLVRATPHLESSSTQRQRVFSNVTSQASGRRRGSLPAIATVVSILAAATIAAAAVGHFRALYPSHPAVAASAPAFTAPAVAPPAVSEIDSADPPVPPDSAKAKAASPALPERPSARIRAAAPFKDGEDPTPVLEGIRALRYDGDPSRAGVLLAQYLKAHPHGVLSEDASALSIEAAVARHDTHAAGELGRRYLAQFPNGRYRAFALQSVQASAP